MSNSHLLHVNQFVLVVFPTSRKAHNAGGRFKVSLKFSLNFTTIHALLLPHVVIIENLQHTKSAGKNQTKGIERKSGEEQRVEMKGNSHGLSSVFFPDISRF